VRRRLYEAYTAQPPSKFDTKTPTLFISNLEAICT
jgi:hypothetical protein